MSQTITNIQLPHPVIWKRWNVKKGDIVNSGTILGYYKIEGDTAKYTLKSKVSGGILNIEVTADENVDKK